MKLTPTTLTHLGFQINAALERRPGLDQQQFANVPEPVTADPWNLQHFKGKLLTPKTI